MKYNLLEEELFQIKTESGRKKKHSLPGLFKCLSGNDEKIVSFSKLLVHQKQAWFSFLVQLAAMALDTAKMNTFPNSKEKWREILQNMVKEYPDESPWHIIVSDLNKPAFFQPPVPECSLEGFSSFSRPDEDSTIDLLSLAKNHDIKKGKIIKPEIENWIFSMITVQTMEGFSGRENYGISRMNSGYGSRPFFSFISDFNWNSRFQRDINILLDKREDILKKYSHYKRNRGEKLLWIQPWDGKESVSVNELDPYYIEICRRLRLVDYEGKIKLMKKNTKCPKVGVSNNGGNTGDPWAPVNIKKGSVFTIGEAGLRYDKLERVLFSGDYKFSICMKAEQDENLLYSSAIARGQGKTEGFHERLIYIPKKAKNFLMDKGKKQKIAELSKSWVDDASSGSKILRNSLLCILQGDIDNLNFRDNRTDKWQQLYSSKVDRRFFECLWEAIETFSDNDDYEKWFEKERIKWRENLKSMAEKIFKKARKGLPTHSALKYKMTAMANRRFYGGFYKFIKEVKN